METIKWLNWFVELSSEFPQILINTATDIHTNTESNRDLCHTENVYSIVFLVPYFLSESSAPVQAAFTTSFLGNAVLTSLQCLLDIVIDLYIVFQYVTHLLEYYSYVCSMGVCVVSQENSG